MRRTRGWIALGVATALGLVAARGTHRWLERTESRRVADVSAPPPESAVPATFSEQIPDGLRAVSLEVDEVTGVSRELVRGDRVDVIATTPLPNDPEGSVSRVLLERARVHAVASEGLAGEGGRRSARAWTVSLLVSPEDAVTLAAARGARLHLAARNAADGSSAGAAERAFTRAAGASFFQREDVAPIDAIPHGLRAATIEVRDTDGVCAMLRRGDRVDVIVTSPFRWFDAESHEPGAQGVVRETQMVARTLLQDVEVLATEKAFEAGADPVRPVGKVTLLVTPQDAEKLAVASDATRKSLLRLVARNLGDHERVGTDGELLADLLTDQRESFRVDIHRGGQKTPRIFHR